MLYVCPTLYTYYTCVKLGDDAQAVLTSGITFFAQETSIQLEG